MQPSAQSPILVIHRDFEGKTIAGIQLRRILAELEAAGFTILRGSNLSEGRIVTDAHRGLCSILVSGEWEENNRTVLKDLTDLVRAAKSRSPGLPVFVMG